ncbi:MAG: kelch repeat-containing protein [Planctomycetota bacterium]
MRRGLSVYAVLLLAGLAIWGALRLQGRVRPSADFPKQSGAAGLGHLVGFSVAETAALAPQNGGGWGRIAPMADGSGFAPVESAEWQRLSDDGPCGHWFPTAKPVLPVFPKSFADAVRVGCGVTPGAPMHDKAWPGLFEAAATPVGGRSGSLGEIAPDGGLVYANAFDGCDVIYRSRSTQTEEFLVVRQPRPEMSWSWDLGLGSNDKALKPRLTVAHTVELVDKGGVPRLRISAPNGKDAAGVALRAGERLKLALNGTRLTLTADLSGLKAPVVIDPSWTTTGRTTFSRKYHTSTLLNDGRVLVAGGDSVWGGGGAPQWYELFDSTSRTWSVGPGMQSARHNHTATLLKDGKVLLIGGAFSPMWDGRACEMFDPATNTTLAAPPMSYSRFNHTATMLGNGLILVTGGFDVQDGTPQWTCEVYDPTAGTWTTTGNMIQGRAAHAATVLKNGQVLVTGGFSAPTTSSGGPPGGIGGARPGVVELYDPSTMSWVATGPVSGVMNTCPYQTTTLLNSGKVLLVGGLVSRGVFNAYSNTTFQFDPTTFTARQLGEITARANHTTAVLPDGKVLVIGGQDISGYLDTCWLYDETFGPGGYGRWTPTSSLTYVRACHSATTLANGQILVVNGDMASATTFGDQRGTCEVFDPAIRTAIVSNTNDSGPGSWRCALGGVGEGDTITFDTNVFDLTNSDAATVINVLSPLPPVNKDKITIDAQDCRVTINGAGAGTSNGLTLLSLNNKIMGLTIVGFTGSGIAITSNGNVGGGSSGNVIGGSRLVGKGPNGQGLRIANCGAYGIQISNGMGNVVKGCWLGLSSSGTEAQGNLAGILLDQGSKNNTIGGSADGESNTISGNSYEGLTVSGDGTDDNTVVGNIIGAAAVAETSLGRAASRGNDYLMLASRAAVANGSAGVFLSRGTQGTRVGGEGQRDPNLVANNGGRGVEVRATNSRCNSSRGNLISRNAAGGIALYDGSNDGVAPPVFSSVQVRNSVAGRDAAGRSILHASLQGTAGTAGGTVEVFSDPGSQGGTFLSRAAVNNGIWQLEVDVSDAENLTATFTDANGNTSPFAVYGPANGGGSQTAVDSDADGVPDYIEALAGTDPNNASDVPTHQGVLTADKFALTLGFAKTGHDTIKATFDLSLPTGMSPANSVIGVAIGGFSSDRLTLNNKAKSPNGDVTIAVAPGKTSSTALVTFSLKNKDLRAALATNGLANKTTAKSGEVDTVPIVLGLTTADGKHYYYDGSMKVLYKATQGKTGSGKLTK